MGLFTKKKEKKSAGVCPCGDPMENSHALTHTKEVPGGFIFECTCGVSTMKWPGKHAAATAMEVHCDRDHGTSATGFDPSSVAACYREFFPSGRATN